MAFTYYAHTDAGAPVLSGTSGALIALLQACLVTGYGAKAAAGWSRPWLDAGGNKAVYKPNDAQDAFVYINDDNAFSAGGAMAALFIAANHDGAGNITNAAPNNIGLTTGYAMHKASSAGSTARPWHLWADGKTAYLVMDSQYNTNEPRLTVFGKALALSPFEAFPWIVTGGTGAAYYYQSAGDYPLTYAPQSPHAYKQAATPFNADGTATAAPLFSAFIEALRATSNAEAASNFSTAAPDPYTGLFTIWDGLMVHARAPRFRLRGFSIPHAGGALALGDTFSATIGGVARTYVVDSLGQSGKILIETSDTLDL